jgi:chorismate-pyruvate lyase
MRGFFFTHGNACRKMQRMNHHVRLLAALSGILLNLATARAQTGALNVAYTWPDTFLTRVAALALLETLNADLLSHDSATLTLERWCDQHQLASSPHIIAEQQRGADQPPTAEQRQLLRVTPTEPVRHRHVRLVCGTKVLAEADNWYVPARLTAEMNQRLDTTEAPFGQVVRSLAFQRHTLAAQLLWSPLPSGWEMAATAATPGAGALTMPLDVLRHRALLTLPDGTPFSTVVETYKRNVLDFPAPQLAAPPPGASAGAARP